MKPEIPYEEIDVEIRRLVRLVNAVPGIQSISSCAGHDSDAEAVVSFQATDLDSLRCLVRCLPFQGVRARIWAGSPIVEAIFITTCFAGGKLTHELRVSGSPGFVKLRVIGQIEESLLSPL